MSDDERDRSDGGGLESGDLRQEGMDKGRGEGSQPRTRTMMSPLQLAGLHELWNSVSGPDPITKFPTTAQREALAQKIGLTPRKVQVWFQNQRQKHRRVELQQSSESPTSSSSSAPFPPSSSAYQHPPHPLTASSYVYPPLGDVSEPPSSSDQTARRPSTYDSHSLPPPHPLSAAALPPPPYPSYSSYAQHPPPPPSLPHHTSYFPRNPNESSYPSHRPPTAEDPEHERAKYSHISPPMAIQLRRSPDEGLRGEERMERERRRSGEGRDQEMRDESWDARRSWERGRVDSGGERGEGSSGWYNVAAAGVGRRVSEGEADTREGGGSSGWSSEHGRPVRYASFPGSASSSSYYNTSTPRQTNHPTFYDPPFTPLARPPPHERHPSSHRPRSPMQLFSPSRSTSPPSFSRTSSTIGSQQQVSPPPHHLRPLEEKLISPRSSTSNSPLTPATALPSFRDFLYTTSTTSGLLPSSLPSTAPCITTQFAPQRSSYASSTTSSSNSHQTHPRSSASSRGIGGANEAERGGGRTGRTHTSSSTSSQPRSPTSSSYGGGNRELPLPPPSTFAFTSSSSSSSSNPGLVSSSLGMSESSSRSTLGSPLFPPPDFTSSVPILAHRAGPSSLSGSSSMSSSGHSSSSHRNPPTTPSLFNAFSGLIGSSGSTPAMFALLPLSREGSISDHSSSNNSATAKQVSPALSAGTVGIGLESMEIDEEGGGRGRGGELEGGGGGGLGVRALPGMLDVVGFGGNVGLGKFSVSGGSSR